MKNISQEFINALTALRFKISWKDNVPDLNSLFEEDQAQLVKITNSMVINQTEAIESEKGINTFGFGFPLCLSVESSGQQVDCCSDSNLVIKN